MTGLRSLTRQTAVLGLAFLLLPLTADAGDLVGLSKGHAARLAYAHAADRSVVNISVMATAGMAPSVADAIQALGGRPRFRFDAADFLIAAVPVGAVKQVQALPSVEAVAVDAEPTWPSEGYRPSVFMASADEPAPARGADGADRPWQDAPWPPTARAFPIDAPYPVLRDIDAQAFRAQWPTFDGRGVVVAHVESGPDFLLPELQLAYDLDGNAVPKFLDVVRVPTPVPTLAESPDRQGPGWVRLGESIESTGTRLTVDERSYRVPEPGRYRLGGLVLDTAILGWVDLAVPDRAVPDRAVPDRQDGVSQQERQSGLALAVLWSEAARTAWLDMDRDGDFADEVGVREFAVSGQFGVIGRDDPNTDVRETIAFAVQSDAHDDFLALTFGTNAHASAVAGAVAANRGDRGHIDGVAPGAQLLVVARGKTTSSYGRGLVAAFSDPRTDIVLLEAFSPATSAYGSPRLADGTSVLALLTTRLTRLYDKPSFFTAGNGAGMSTIGDISMAEGVIAVSAYQSRDSVLFNNGIAADRADDLHFTGTHGPAGHGAIKPDLLAPANPLTLYAGFKQSDWTGYPQTLPPGYYVGAGTSIAAPVGAGAAAMLISAARQSGLAPTGRAINRALLNSTRFLDGIPAYRQGHGLVQVASAWRTLARDPAGPGPIDIAVSAPVKTATSHLLRPPHTGVGLFEREGWRAGEPGERTILLTRTTGPRQPMTFQTRWVGNGAGTFSSAATVTLPLHRPVPVTVAIAPRTPGAHSAILYIDHGSVTGPVAGIGVTVVAADDFRADNGHSIAKTFQVGRPSGRVSHFFRVPPGADAVSLEFEHASEWLSPRLLSPANRAATGWLAIDPVWQKGQATIPNPAPGVWEALFWERGGRDFSLSASHRPLKPHEVRMRVSLFGLDVRRTDDGTAARRFGDGAVQSGLVASNRFAPFKGSVVSTPLAHLRSARRSIRAGEQHSHDVSIHDGAELLVVDIMQAGAHVLDTDLHVFDCTEGTCVPARRSASYQMAERVLIQDPNPGLWKVVVDASTAAGGSAEYDYRAFFTHPRFGMTSVADPRIWRQTGQRWEVVARSWNVVAPLAEGATAQVIYATNPLLQSLHAPIRPEPALGPGIKLYRASRFDRNVVPLGLSITETYDADVVLR